MSLPTLETRPQPGHRYVEFTRQRGDFRVFSRSSGFLGDLNTLFNGFIRGTQGAGGGIKLNSIKNHVQVWSFVDLWGTNIRSGVGMLWDY